jgi:hypothetical protein
MNYFKYMPTEIYKEFLFQLEPKDVIHTCTIDKYALSICDDIFYHNICKETLSQGYYFKPRLLL